MTYKMPECEILEFKKDGIATDVLTDSNDYVLPSMPMDQDDSVGTGWF